MTNSVVRIGKQCSIEHGYVHGNGAEHRRDCEWSGSQPRFQIQEEEASDEDEDGQNDSRACFEEFASDNLRLRCVAVDVTSGEVGEKDAQIVPAVRLTISD